MPTKDGRGGKRHGAGRKPKGKVALPLDRNIATRVLGRIDEEFYWLLLLHWDEVKSAMAEIEAAPKMGAAIVGKLRETIGKSECAMIGTHLERLTNRRDGTAPQRIDTAFNPETPLRVVIEHIGRPKDQAAAKAKSASRSVE